MYYFIVNPASRTGNGMKVWKIVQNKLQELHIEYRVYFTRYKYHAKKIAQEICASNLGNKKIVILGGDGTVNEVINGIDSYNDVILGYIPSGSSNDLARSLKIPADPLKALDRILNGKYYDYIDHGVVSLSSGEERKKFAVSMGIGFDASVTYEALNSRFKWILNKIKLGKLTYPLLAIKQLIRHKPTKAHVIVDNHKEYHYNRVFFIANMIQVSEGGGLKMAPNADCKDGKLTVCIIHDLPKIAIIFILPAMIFGKHPIFPGVELFDATTIEIKMDKKIMVHTDGEYYGTYDHIVASCTEEAVRMIL